MQQRQLEYIPLEELSFDPENPRIPVGRQGDSRVEHLHWLLERANLLDLMKSIGQQGFFPGEPILVVKDGAGGYKVVEGNRRFGACLLLSYPEDAPVKKRSVAEVAKGAQHRPNRIPALVFDSEGDVLGMLGYRHITGIQEWGPLAKSRYLLRLWESADGPAGYDERLRYLARTIGSRSDYVARLLTAHQLFEEIARNDFFSIDGLSEETLAFSLLVVALNRPLVADFLGLEDGQDFGLDGLEVSRLEELTRWLFAETPEGGTVLGESRNMTKFVQAISSTESLEALRNGSTLDNALAGVNTTGRDLESLVEALEDDSRELVELWGFAPEDHREAFASRLNRVVEHLGQIAASVRG